MSEEVSGKKLFNALGPMAVAAAGIGISLWGERSADPFMSGTFGPAVTLAGAVWWVAAKFIEKKCGKS